MLHGVRWVVATRVFSEILIFVSGVVLARLIAPPEFGRAVVALVIGSIATVLVTNAFASLLVQQEHVSEDEIRSAVALNVSIGLLLSLGVFALAKPLSLLGSHSPPQLVRMVSPVCLLAGINAVPAAMLSRKLDFRKLSMIDAASLLIQTAVSVLLAILGAGGAAIVLGVVTGRLIATIGSVAACRPPLPAFRRDTIRRQLSFGTPNALSAVIFTGYQNEDYAIIGARLGPTQLAFYYRAFMYGVEYQGKISRILAQMAFPIFSRLRSLDEIRAMRSRMVRIHAAVLFPILAGYAVLAPTFIPWLLGERWSPVVLPSQFLVVAGAVSTLLTGNGALILALGRTDLLLYWNLGHFISYGLVVYFVAPHGIVWVAAVGAGFYIVHGLAVHWFILRRVAGIPMRDLWHELMGPCTGVVALLACSIPARLILTDASSPPFLTLLVAGTAGTVAYLICLRQGFKDLWQDLGLLVRRTLRNDRAVPDAAGASDRGAIPALPTEDQPATSSSPEHFITRPAVNEQ